MPCPVNVHLFASCFARLCSQDSLVLGDQAALNSRTFRIGLSCRRSAVGVIASFHVRQDLATQKELLLSTHRCWMEKAAIMTVMMSERG